MDALLHHFNRMVDCPPRVTHHLSRRVNAFVGADFWDISRLHIPVLVIHDEDDEQIPVAEGNKLAELWSQVQVVTTRGLGHRKILRDPQVIDRTVAFLAGPS